MLVYGTKSIDWEITDLCKMYLAVQNLPVEISTFFGELPNDQIFRTYLIILVSLVKIALDSILLRDTLFSLRDIHNLSSTVPSERDGYFILETRSKQRYNLTHSKEPLCRYFSISIVASYVFFFVSRLIRLCSRFKKKIV